MTTHHGAVDNKARRGRPLAGDPEKRAEGVRLLLAGEPERAVEVSGLSLRTLYRARDAAQASAGAEEPERLATPLPSAISGPSGAEDADLEGIVAEEVPTLARVRRLIARVEKKLEQAPDVRFATIGALLERLYWRERQLQPPTPEPEDEVVRRLRALDGELIRRIETHLPDRIDPAELGPGWAWLDSLRAFAGRLPAPWSAELSELLEAPWGAPAARKAKAA